MKIALIFLTLCLSLVAQAQYSFPTGMSTSDINRIVERFGVSFLGKTPPSFTEDNLNSQISLGWNWVDTKEVSKLGNGNYDRVIQYQDFYYTQELPYQVEIGLHANLLMLSNSVSTYGGYARWTFAKIPFGALALRAQGTSANYRSLLSVNMAGGLVEADFYLGSFILTAGIGQIRATAQMKATVFGLSGSQPVVRMTERYTHELLRVTYVFGRWNLSAQSDRIRDAQNSLLLGYVF